MDSTKDDNVKVVTSGEDVAVHKSALNSPNPLPLRQFALAEKNGVFLGS
jgi:hypothetical protein